ATHSRIGLPLPASKGSPSPRRTRSATRNGGSFMTRRSPLTIAKVRRRTWSVPDPKPRPPPTVTSSRPARASTSAANCASARYGPRSSATSQALLKAGAHRGPLVGQDRVVDRVAQIAVREAHMPAEDSLAHGAQALDGGLRAQVAPIGLQGNARCSQLVEGIGELEQLGFGV